MHIRPYEPRDADAVTDILMPVFRAGDTYAIDPDILPADALAYWTGPERAVFVAEEDDVLLGTYYIVRNQKGGGSHVCNCGYVTAAKARGRGVARAMLTHSLEVAPRLGFRAMQYNFVVSTNTRAVDIWQKAGFEIVGRLPGAFQHPTAGFVDALVMYKAL
ncbi:GNAT family N-acetyltransferase [Thalassococcus lentus]|uniref:GNAT family N-acetyltransferase n=1 Tax=Thalassococcus lentus TaxID=1210524 RepID=A0ABT4XNP1_9RHOB|nr:GNAT family N-acetyltransferase [Thalassococcus lentus]MDA7423563.1 GNAT family N-acetyltransferase [Thalassococcus lentus]